MKEKDYARQDSGFSGFLDGYKARNISTSASSVEYLFGEMTNAAMDILSSQRVKKAPQELLDSLDRISKVLSNNQGDILSKAVSCGEILKTIIVSSKLKGDPSSLLVEEKMKKLIYYYLEFAELSEDKTISDLAITIGEMF